MSDLRQNIAALRRPRLLMRAVRHGLSDRRRSRLLRQFAIAETCPRARVAQLIEAEARLEATRLAGDASYSPARHVEILVALVAAAEALPRPAIAA